MNTRDAITRGAVLSAVAMLAMTGACGRTNHKSGTADQASPNNHTTASNGKTNTRGTPGARSGPGRLGPRHGLSNGPGHGPGNEQPTATASSLPKLGTFPAASQQDMATLSNGMNRFALALYGRLAKQHGNLFFSPWSISMALAMTHLGARGKTAAEMESTLHLPKAHADQAFGTLFKDLTGPAAKAVTFNMANRLFPQVGYGLEAAFTKAVARYYGSTSQPVNYGNTEAAVAAINGWVKKQTKGRIPHLLSANNVPADTRLVLVNTIFFKGLWQKRFLKAATSKGPFF